MTIVEILNYVNTSLKSSFGSAVEAIKKYTFSVKFPEIQKIRGDVKADVKFPEVQKVSVKFPENQKVSGKVETDLKESINLVVKRIEELKKVASDKGVEITNFPKIPSEVKISNFPKEKTISFAGLENKLDVLIASMRKLPTKFPDFPTIPDYPKQKTVVFPKAFEVSNLEGLKSDSPKDYVPVRLTDGDKFYKAIEEFYQSVTSQVTFKNAEGKKSSALVDADRHVQVDVLTMPDISVDTSVLATSDIQTNGSQKTKITNVLVTEPYDSITATYPDTSTEVYTYKLEDSIVATVTVTYSDAVTKDILTSVVKT